MTAYATHRFSIGQPVSHSADSMICEVIAQIGGAEAPEYRIRSFDGTFEAQVPERELSYAPGLTNAPHDRKSIH